MVCIERNPLQPRAQNTATEMLLPAGSYSGTGQYSIWSYPETTEERGEPGRITLTSHRDPSGSRQGWAGGTDLERLQPAFEGAKSSPLRPWVSHTLQLHLNILGTLISTEYTKAIASCFTIQPRFIRKFIRDVFQCIYFVWLGRTYELSEITAALSSRKGRKM